jgi:acyl transferase domain-containing protein/SAM-dependent methyltransferase/acyl carrier protein
MTSMEPIAIIGIGCRMPGGVRSTDDLWSLLSHGVDAISEVPSERWNPLAIYHPDPSKPGRMNSRWGGFLDHIDRFDAQFFGINPREAAAADPQQRLLLEVAYSAAEDAGLTLHSLAGTRAGVYVGISSYDYSLLQLNDRGAIDGYTNLGSSHCIAANRLSYFFNLIGASLAVDTACSSSLVAAHLGCQSLWTGENELAFVAGVNLILRPETTIGFSKASMLSPDGRCRSFDARANGYVRGEGSAVVILKPLARALADGNRVHAVIRATAVNQDGRTDGITVPNRASQAANIIDALRLANIVPESVQYVEAHGTGTPVGDPIEAAAIGATYGKARSNSERCVIGSIKSNIGHLESASGIAGLIKAALCLQHRQIPATLHFEQAHAEIDLNDLRLHVAQQLQPWPETNGQPARAAVNSFGFGGTNAHAILEAPPERAAAFGAKTQCADGRARLLPLSARSAAALTDLARSYLNELTNAHTLQHAPLHDICFSAAHKRSHHEHRLALVAHNKAELAEQLEAFLHGQTGVSSSTGKISGSGSWPVFVCSGMGQQWWAMGRELLAQEPVYREAVGEVSALFGQLAGWSLLDKLSADEQNSEIQHTHIGQPAIFATQVALAALWQSWGIPPAAIVGHSAGEIAASYICGALSLEDAVLVAFHRSRLQYLLAGQGAMLAAGISRHEAMRLVERHPQAISLAAINGPSSVTLSGDAAVLAEIDKALNEAGVFSRPLQVDVPFHCPKMEQIETELLECLSGIRPRRASKPFISTVTGTTLAGTELDGAYWYRNVRQSVLFSDAMGELIGAGHRLFLEIGAHPILRVDIAGCLRERSTQGAALGSLRRAERERASLLGSLGELYTLGCEIDWQRLFPSDLTAVQLPLYPFQAETHWRESDQARRTRTGHCVHPLLGDRLEGPQPSWQVELDTARLSYLVDHRVGDSTIFPGAGYVEMGLAAARETFGPVPCALDEVEFQNFLTLDRDCTARVVLDSGDFSVFARANSLDDTWELQARGHVRQLAGMIPAPADIGNVRRRCPEPVSVEDCFQLFADLGLHYGPTFRGIALLWRGEREALAEIRIPRELREQRSDYRLHPAVLDACFQSALAALPANSWRASKGVTYVPVRIERFRFHATPPNHFFSRAQVNRFDPSELNADIQLLDSDGNCLVEIQGFVCRSIQLRAQPAQKNSYELEWELSLRRVPGARRLNHLPSPATMAPIIEEAKESLNRRFSRHRFQNEFHSLWRATAAAYIVRALRMLGWKQSAGAMSIESLSDQAVAPQYHRWLRLMAKELTAHELSASAEPQQLWKTLWEQFPESQIEAMVSRICGEHLPAVLRGDVDPLNLLFPEGELTNLESFYQDSPTLRFGNLLTQKAVLEIVRCLPPGKALRILEVGGGTGGTTSFILPVLPENCTEYVFTDVSPRFLAHAQPKFERYSFVQYRTLDIENDPIEQGFDPHSFDLIIACDVLHATRDLRRTLHQVKQLLGSGGMLALVELTRPWLGMHLIFSLLKGWWLFDDDIRQDQPCISQDQWRSLLCESGFSETVCIADCPELEHSQHSLILARGPQLPFLSTVVPQAPEEPKAWLLFTDQGVGGRPSVGTQLALRLRERGDNPIQVMTGASFRRSTDGAFTIRAGNPEDMRHVIAEIGKEAQQLAGVVYLWSLDAESGESMTSAVLMSSAMPSCVGALQLFQALAAAESCSAGGIWLVTRSAQWIDNRADPLQLAQSPFWGLGRVAMTEYQNLHCRLVDLTTCSREEIDCLVEELNAGDDAEDEIALHGELRYVHRLRPVSAPAGHGSAGEPGQQPFRIELQRPGIVESLSARSFRRMAPKSNEVEVEIAAAGLNFKDLMLAMGMVPKEALANDAAGRLLGLEFAGRVVSVGDHVSEFAVGDDVVGVGRGLASHITVDQRFVARKPNHLTFEQAVTIPSAFLTAWYSLHTLGQTQPGERVLIHSATGGVGLAAVQLAQRAGATVFATAGSPEKRELLRALGVPHVMNSRTLAFADELLKLTEGEGVDLVLNSLAGEAIEKNLSILRPYGRCIEIGITDIYQNRKIGMRPLRKNISLFAVDLGADFVQRGDRRPTVLREVLERFENNELRPLPHRVFPVARVVDALRQMAQAKHVGKLVVSMNDAEGLQIEPQPRAFALDPDAAYLITGGLGGFGLAVADRLVRRGARQIALAGRGDPSPSALAAVDVMRQRGAEVRICKADITDREQAREVIANVQRSMGPLRGIIHAAMVLDDTPIERMTEERMAKAMAPKIMGAWNLHKLTTDAPLDFFVLFSSFVSVVGNPGQANYAAGNAFLDALAHYRRIRGLPALSVNWGALQDVGHVANSPETLQRFDRLGVKAMPIAEALDALDELMASNTAQIAVARMEWKDFLRSAWSRVPARFADFAGEAGREDRQSTMSSRVQEILEADESALPSLLESYVQEILARAMRTSPAQIDPQQPLRNLGLDSLIAVEVRNYIKADLNLSVPMAKFTQDASIGSLATYVAERLHDPDGSGQRSDAVVHAIVPGNGSDIAVTGDDSSDLIERIDELTDEEVDRQLDILIAQERT